MRLRNIIIPAATVLTIAIASWVTSGGMGWYRTIVVPGWTPAGMIIGIVWTVLFALAMSSALIVFNRSKTKALRGIAIVYVINAILNVGWSLTFFGLHRIGASIFVSALLDVSVIALIVRIRPISRIAAWLLVPYALWVTFATYLTYAIWRLT